MFLQRNQTNSRGLLLKLNPHQWEVTQFLFSECVGLNEGKDKSAGTFVLGLLWTGGTIHEVARGEYECQDGPGDDYSIIYDTQRSIELYALFKRAISKGGYTE